MCMTKFYFELASYLSSEFGSKLWEHLDPIQTLAFKVHLPIPPKIWTDGSTSSVYTVFKQCNKEHLHKPSGANTDPFFSTVIP